MFLRAGIDLFYHKKMVHSIIIQENNIFYHLKMHVYVFLENASLTNFYINFKILNKIFKNINKIKNGANTSLRGVYICIRCI